MGRDCNSPGWSLCWDRYRSHCEGRICLHWLLWDPEGLVWSRHLCFWVAGVSWDESCFPHFLGENVGKQMVLSPRAWSGTVCLRAACESSLGLPRLPEDCRDESTMWQLHKQEHGCFLRGLGRQMWFNKLLFSSMRLCHFEGRKNLLQPAQPCRCDSVNLHDPFTKGNAGRGWKQSTTTTCQNSLAGEEEEWPPLEVFKKQEWDKMIIFLAFWWWDVY